MRALWAALWVCSSLPAAWAQDAPRLMVRPQVSGVAVGLRGLCVVDASKAWASGGGGSVLRTEDGGAHWASVDPPGAGDLQFRDVHAWDGAVAVILSAGSPTRAYRTEDGGKHWGLAYEDSRPEPFYDAMDFWDSRRGVAFGDPLEGRLLVIETADGGTTWTELPAEHRPQVGHQEGGFAASGTCLTVGADGRIWIGLGGEPAPGESATASVVFSGDGGKSWRKAATPLPRSASAGVFSLAMWDARHGVLVGGDYQQPQLAEGNIAVTADGGATWRAPSGPPPSGFRSAVAVATLQGRRILVAAGENGLDLSADDGQTWRRVSEQGYHALQFAPGQSVGWAVGAEGRIARLRLESP